VKSIAWQGVRFLVVGGIATVTDGALFWLLVRAGIDPRASNMTSYPLSAVVAFLLHRKWTFAVDEGDTARQAPRFAVLVVAGLLLSTAIIWILAPWLGPFPAKAIALCGTMTLNFTLSRLLVFAPDRVAGYQGDAA
jgi:putative flippase GtrA